jgi:hypothetical protein
LSFFISLDRYEVLNRAGSGLFFIMMTISNLNLKKMLLQLRSFRVRFPGTVTIRWTFCLRTEDFSSVNTRPQITITVAVCGKTGYWRSSYYVGNYQFKESTRRIVIHLGIKSSGTRNPPEE